MEDQQRPEWIKEQTKASDFEVIQAKAYDDIKDFRMDKVYVLIRIYPEAQEIGVAICSPEHVILKEFRGKHAKDLYFTIFSYAETNNQEWFTRLDHAAYLGKELKKAEIALASDSEYMQE